MRALLLVLVLLWPVAAFGESPIAVLDEGDRIELFEARPAHCVAGSRGARYIYQDGTPVAGCWQPVEVSGKWYVLTHFVDGDKLAFEPKQFTWISGQHRRPAQRPGLM